jgi:hypothetical protein
MLYTVMASDYKELKLQSALTTDYSESLFSIYMNVFKVSSERMSPQDARTSELFRWKFYIHILQLYLQCCSAECADSSRAFRPPWVNGVIGPRYRYAYAYELERVRELYIMGTPENKAAYQRARESLDKHYRESGLEEALNWLEVPCCYEDENAVEDFRKWPLKFPVSVRQVAKLQLFLTQYSCHRQPKLCLLEKCTEIWFNDPGCPFVVKIDNNTGVFEVVRKGGIFFWRAIKALPSIQIRRYVK